MNLWETPCVVDWIVLVVLLALALYAFAWAGEVRKALGVAYRRGLRDGRVQMRGELLTNKGRKHARDCYLEGFKDGRAAHAPVGETPEG